MKITKRNRLGLSRYQTGNEIGKPQDNYIDKILDYELAQGGPGGTPLPLHVAFKFKSTGDPVKDRQIARKKVEKLDAKYSEYGNIPGLKERMVDFAVNSEDPRAALLEAAGYISPGQKGKYYRNGKLDTNMVDRLWSRVDQGQLNSIMNDPSFIQKFDQARDRSYRNTNNADINYESTWGPRVNMWNDDPQTDQNRFNESQFTIVNEPEGNAIDPSIYNQGQHPINIPSNSLGYQENQYNVNDLVDDGTFEEVPIDEAEAIQAEYNYNTTQNNLPVIPYNESIEPLNKIATIQPDGNTYEVSNQPRTPKFIQQVGQMLDPTGQIGNLFKINGRNRINNVQQRGTNTNFTLNDLVQDNNPHKGIYEDDRTRLRQTQDLNKDMRQRNIAEMRETVAQRKTLNANNRLNRKSDRNIFLKAKQQELGKTAKYKTLAKTIKDADKLEDKITALKERHNKKREKIGKFGKQPRFMNDEILQQEETNQVGGYQNGGNIPKFQKGYGDYINWGTSNGLMDVKESPSSIPTYTKPTNVPDYNWDPKVGDLAAPDYGQYSTPENQFNKPIKQVSQSSSNFNPYKLNVYGNKLSENAVNRTTAFNLSQQLQPDYYNPLIKPDLMSKRQLAQVDYTNANDQERTARRQIAQNSRSTAGIMGNLQQLAANMTKAKYNVARAAQDKQSQYDAKWMQEKQQDANQLAQAKRAQEQANKSDYAAKQQALSDTFTQWEKGDRERAKLYNQELLTHNQKEYANQLSNEYKAVTDENGVVSIIHLKTGKVDPKKTQEVNALGQGPLISGYSTTKKKGGKVKGTEINMNRIKNTTKKRRNRLF